MVALGWWREQREMIIMGHWLSLKVMGTFMGWLWWRLHASMYVNHWLSPCVIFFFHYWGKTPGNTRKEDWFAWLTVWRNTICHMAHSLKGYNLLHGSQFEGIQAIVWLSVWRDTVCHIRKYMGRNEATAHIFRQQRRTMAQAASSFFLFIQSRTLVYGMVPPIFGAHLPYPVKPLWNILTDTPRSMSPKEYKSS